MSRAVVLPKSGVGVAAPWLVIAPPGNRPIWFDLRALDEIELMQLDDVEDDVEQESGPDERWAIVLVLGDLDIALRIADGKDAAFALARSADLARRGELPAATTPLETVPRDGRLIILSSTHPDDPVQVDDLAGRVLSFAGASVTIGGADDNDHVIVHRSISRHHARITRDPETGTYSLHDVESTNEVRVNGAPVTSIELRGGDTIDLGHVCMSFDGSWPPKLLEPPTVTAPEQILFVGADPVVVRGDYLLIGTSCGFRISEVADYAQQGANIPLGGGNLLQAGLAMLVVTHARRPRGERQSPWLGMHLARREMRIRDVVPGSAADVAGVRAGDEWRGLFATSRTAVYLRVQRDSENLVIPVIAPVDGGVPDCFALIEQPAPPFPGLADLTGHVVILAFFEGSSAEELALQQALQALLGRHPALRVIGVTAVEPAPMTGFPFIHDVEGALATAYRAPAPLYVVIDRDGVVQRVDVGLEDVALLERWLVARAMV